MGGVGRIGGNMMVYETISDLIVVDCGACFPGPDEPGVDWLVPKIDYLLTRRDKLRAYLITHGHEDHIGALPHILAQLPAPVHATRFTMALIERKLGEREMSAEIAELRDGAPVELGSIAVEPLAVTHSIPGAAALAVSTPAGVLIHSGDFKLDPTPLDGRLTATERLADLGRAGVTALLSDSTNAQQPGHTSSEQCVSVSLRRLISEAPHRVLVTTFSSNVFRLQSIIDASAAAGRRVTPVGRSCRQILQLSLERGYLRAPHGIFVEPEKLGSLARGESTIIASGCQAEEYSAFASITRGQHAQVRLEPGDWAIMSARRIPGNEHTINRAVNALLRQGIEVLDDRNQTDIHASGHAYAAEQEQLIELCAPRFFIPIHGEHRHLRAHANTAAALGFEAHLIEDGQPLELTRDGRRVTAHLAAPEPAGYVCLDGTDAVPDIVTKDRRILNDVGFVSGAVVIGPDGRLAAAPEIITRGVIHVDENVDLLDAAAREVGDAVAGLALGAGEPEIQEAVRLTLRRFFRRELGRRPVILPVVITLTNGASIYSGHSGDRF